MLKTIAVIFGIVMLGLGILGFIPGFTTPAGHLFGIFHVNAVHNVIHIISGIAGIICGLITIQTSRLFFQIFGVFYGLMALMGFYYGDMDIMDMVANNMADTWLHVAIAVVAIYLGFIYESERRGRKS